MSGLPTIKNVDFGCPQLYIIIDLYRYWAILPSSPIFLIYPSQPVSVGTGSEYCAGYSKSVML